MLSFVEIQNFKSIRNLKLDFEQLNVFVGPNSSGKTSVIQALALLKQSIDKLNFRGPLIDIGNFKEAIYNHRSDGKLRFSLGFFQRDKMYLSRKFMIACHITIKMDDANEPFVDSSIITQGRKELIDYQKKTHFGDDGKSSHIGYLSQFNNVNFEMRGIIPYASGGAVEEMERYREVYDVIASGLKDFLYYVSAKRGFCTRSATEDLPARKPHDVGVNGNNTIALLAHIQNDDEYSEAIKKIDFWAEAFGLKDTVVTVVEGKEKAGHSIKVKNAKTNIQSNITDVGFGVNQLLPVIVQCFCAPKGSLIMVEQPEAHLHPKYQAKIADLLIDVLNFGNRLIVETHSEHVLLRLQRRIAEKKLLSKLLVVNYFDIIKNQTIVKKLTIEETGHFKEPIPKGFFEEGYQETLAHIRALQQSGE